MIRLYQHRQRGISLLEVMVGLAVIAVGLIAVVKFKSNFMQYNSNARQQILATTLAENKVEQLRHYQTLSPTPGTSSYDEIDSGDERITTDNTQFNLVWEVTTNQNPSYKVVDVTVSWLDQNNRTHSIDLTTIIARIDPSQSGRLQQVKLTVGQLIP